MVSIFFLLHVVLSVVISRNPAITCKARLKEQDGFFPGAVEHSHSPTLGITEAAQVRAKIRTETQLHPFIPGSQIVESVFHEYLDLDTPGSSVAKSIALARAANRQRK